MRSMIVGCALLLFGSCAAMAQQDTPTVQGGSPSAPAAAPSPTSPAMNAPAAPAMAPKSGMGMQAMHRPMMKHHRGMRHHRMMKRHMMRHHRMMRHHHGRMHMIPAAKGRYNKG